MTEIIAAHLEAVDALLQQGMLAEIYVGTRRSNQLPALVDVKEYTSFKIVQVKPSPFKNRYAFVVDAEFQPFTNRHDVAGFITYNSV